MLPTAFSWASCSVYRPVSWKRSGGWAMHSRKWIAKAMDWPQASFSGCCGHYGTYRLSTISGPLPHTAPTGCRFSRVHRGHDGHASADRVDLHEHEKRVVGAAHARKFDRFPGHFQRTTDDKAA